MLKKNFLLALIGFFSFASCNSEFNAIKEQDLDNRNIAPKVGAELLSAKGIPDQTAINKRVLITAHGFTATPFENQFTIFQQLI